MNYFQKTSITFILSIIMLLGSTLKAQNTDKGYMDDVNSVENLVTAVLETISGDKGVARDWERFQNLFLPTAKLNAVYYKNDSARVNTYTVDEFIAASGTWYADNGFQEYAYKNQIDTFSNIANVFQSYGAKLADGVEVSRGINSYQLVYTQNRWWIVSLIWNDETDDNKVPNKYLD